VFDPRNTIHDVHRVAPNLRVGHVPGLLMTIDAPAMQRFLDGIREAGLPE
jgi:hypothetical protein